MLINCLLKGVTYLGRQAPLKPAGFFCNSVLAQQHNLFSIPRLSLICQLANKEAHLNDHFGHKEEGELKVLWTNILLSVVICCIIID